MRTLDATNATFRRPLLSLFCLLMLSPAMLQAQEELPTPAQPQPAAPPAAPSVPDRATLREQRRERLRQFGGQILDSLPIGGDTTERAKAIDVDKVNTGLRSIIEALLTGGMQDIESLRIGFDPAGTNFAQDRVRLNIDAALRRSPWADAPSKVLATVDARIAPNGTGSTAAFVDGRIQMQTQTLALVNYALENYREHPQSNDIAAPTAISNEPRPGLLDPPGGFSVPATTPSQPVAPPTPADVPRTPSSEELFNQRLAEKLNATGEIKSLDELADLITTISGLRVTEVSDRLEQVQRELRVAIDPTVRKKLEADLASARVDRDRLFQVRPKFERGPDGAVRVITFQMDSEMVRGADLRNSIVRLTDSDVQVELHAVLTGWTDLYGIIKPTVLSVIERIQNGDPQVVENARLLIGNAVERSRQKIIERRAN